MSYTPGASGGVVADPASPHDVDAGAASVGISEKFSRGDHRHHVATGSPVALTPGASSAPGSSANLAAADHVHALPAFGTSAGTFAEGSDSRITSAVQPARQIIAGTGLSGGGSFAADRTLSVSFGTSSTTVTVGNDSRLADDRTASGLRTASGIVTVSAAAAPAASSVLTASSGTAASWQPLPVGVVPSRQIIAGTGLAGGGDLTADRTLSLVFGTASGTACSGNDPRLSDARVPTGTAGGGLGGSYPSPSVLYGTSSTTAARGDDARLSDPRVPTGAASGQLAGTYPSPTVVAVTSPSGALSIGAIADGQAVMRVGSTLVGADYGDVLGPMSSVAGNLPTWGDGSGELLADSGIAASNVILASDPRITVIQQQQKYYRSVCPTVTNTAGLTGIAYWMFLGRNGPVALLPARVFFWVVTAGGGTAVGEIALATSPAAPARVGQTLTCLASINNAGMNLSLTAGALALHQNTGAFAASFPANSYMWLGIRTACTTSQPSIWGVGYDQGQGNILTTSAAGVLTAGVNYTGALINPTTAVLGTGWLAPDLQMSLA